MSEQWFYQSGQSVAGPLSSAELKYLVTAGRIDRATQVRRGPRDAWQPAAIALGLVKAAPPPPPTPILRATPLQPVAVTPEATDMFAAAPLDIPDEPPRETLGKWPVIVGSAVAVIVIIALLLVLLPGETETAPHEQVSTFPGEKTVHEAPKSKRGDAASSAPSGSQSPSNKPSGSGQPAETGSVAAGGAPPPSSETGDSSGDTHIAFKGETVSLPTPPPPNPTPTDNVDSTPSTSATNNGPGDGSGGDAKQDEGGAAFFGIPTLATSVAYVVDCSGSMQGEPFDAARNELIRSIGELQEGQKFYVAFFNDRAYPQYFPAAEQRMIPVSNDSRKRIERWIRSGIAGGKTNPTEALKYALARNPDAIYFLTDGDFNPDVVDMLVVANLRHIPIHTIAFRNNVGEPLLKTISEQSGGTYRFVSQ